MTNHKSISCLVATIALLATFTLAVLPARADIKLPAMFTDHAVLQRDMPVPVWGWAQPGEEITVTIDQQTKTGTADAKGKWRVDLDPMETGAPRTMTVKGKTDSLVVNDILLGEVWVCSGQSNMAWPRKQAKEGAKEVAAADYPEILLFDVPNAMAPKGPIERIQNKNPIVAKNFCVWRHCTPATAGEFSAVAGSLFRGRADLLQTAKWPRTSGEAASHSTFCSI